MPLSEIRVAVEACLGHPVPRTTLKLALAGDSPSFRRVRYGVYEQVGNSH
jgi:hypothetical protein